MPLPKDAMLLRVFCGETDMHNGKPLSEAIVLKARAMHMAIEIVDTEDKIDAFLSVFGGMMNSGLVTLEKAKVLRYGCGANER
jgi:uncharacterized protein